jgi:molecular chaperone GrpE
MTNKESTLADKKKPKTKATAQDSEPKPDPSSVEAADSREDLPGDGEREPGTAPDQIDELIDNKSVTFDSEAAEPGVELEKDVNDSVRRPSDKEVLNRLLEKNEIILKLNRDNAEKDKQLNDLKEKWLRSVAEFENYRKRTRKEWELLKLQSKTEVILEILGIVDDFERALSVAEDVDDEFVQGIRLINNNLLSVLEKFGVKEIDSLTSSFDPNFHMAVGQLETEDVESGHVAEVIQKGYRLDETVIRPARVIVAK